MNNIYFKKSIYNINNNKNDNIYKRSITNINNILFDNVTTIYNIEEHGTSNMNKLIMYFSILYCAIHQIRQFFRYFGN